MKISEVLHLAAGKYLWDGVTADSHRGHAEYSCDAVGDAIYAQYRTYITSIEEQELLNDTYEHLQSLGVDSNKYDQFNEFEDNGQRQGARYLWLKFAALVAEEEGL